MNLEEAHEEQTQDCERETHTHRNRVHREKHSTEKYITSKGTKIIECIELFGQRE